MFKTCKHCGLEKPMTEFAHSRGRPRSYCKPCWSLKNTRRAKELAAIDPEGFRRHSAKLRALRKPQQMLFPPAPDWWAKHKRRLARKKWIAENPAAMNAARKGWLEKNKHVAMESVKRRQANQRNATPCWANRKKMQEIYAEARRLVEQTGIPHDVDHIVPITSEYVCGLHCEANLQVLPRFDNRSKSNKAWPNMPTELAV